MTTRQVLIIGVAALAVIGGLSLGVVTGLNMPAPPVTAPPNHSTLPSTAASAANSSVASKTASTEAPLSSGSATQPNPESELASRALAATKAAGLKPIVAYVPHPSATPSQIAKAAQGGSAVPLYTGDPAPMGLADYGLSENGDLYVANSGSGDVTVISANTNAVLATLPTGADPFAVAYDAANGIVLVANSGSDSVTAISTATNSVVATMPVGMDPSGVAFDPADGNFYVTNLVSSTVDVLSGATILPVATVAVGAAPSGVAYDSANGYVYVADSGSPSVSAIMPGYGVMTIAEPTEPVAVAYDSGNGDVYTANAASNQVDVISDLSNSVIAILPVGAGTEPTALAYDSANGDVYVADYSSNTITVISGVTNTIIPPLSLVFPSPSGVAYDAQDGDVYVSDELPGEATVLNGTTNSIVATVQVGADPVGIAATGGVSTLNTTALMGEVDISGTGIQGEDLYQSSPDGFAIQMNAVLPNITLFGVPGYEFWAQDVVGYFPNSGYLFIVSNIWNFSAPMAPISANAIASHGPNGDGDGSSLPYYYSFFQLPHPEIYPFDVFLEMNTSVYMGEDNVSFSASIQSPTISADDYNASNFDWVDFSSTAPGPTRILPPPSFTASGSGYNDAGLVNDFELIIGGPGGGSQVDLSSADATLGLYYYNGNEFVPIPSAYNYGSDTGETSTGANVDWVSSAGSPFGSMTTGPSILSGLWGNGAPEGSVPVTVDVSPANAFLFFLYNGTSGFSSPIVFQLEYAPSMVTNVFYLMPGDYYLQAELADYGPTSVLFQVPAAVAGAAVPVDITLKPDPDAGVYTPLWAFDNSELKALAESGAGTQTNPYILWNNQLAPLSANFGLYNDYSFPVFPGVFLSGTTAWVELNNSSTFQTDTNDFQPPGESLPQTNDLQMWFWNVSHVALLNDSNISGWFGQENYFPLTFNSFNVIFYASEHNLIAGNTFLSQSQGLLLYANGTYFGPQNFAGGNNTVWGNDFVQVTPPIACGTATPCLPLLPYYAGLGMEVAEGYDLIYNNLVDTPTTAWLLPINLYSGAHEVFADIFWNVTTLPASDNLPDPVFPTIPLYGSIVGASTQGGNSWWDYGVTDNWANGADNPLGVLPYDENATTLIKSLPTYGCTDYYCKTYIYPGGDYNPQPTEASPVSIAPANLPPNTNWGITLSCAPTHPSPSGGGPPGSVCCAPTHPSPSGGGPPSGVCCAPTHPSPSGGGPPSCTDPPPLVLASFETSAPVFDLVLPDGEYNWTPIPTPGYTSSSGGSFAVTTLQPLSVSVPYADVATGQAILTFRESGLPSGESWSVAVGGSTQTLATDGGTDSLNFLETLGDSYSYSIPVVSGWQQSTLPSNGGTVTVSTAPTTEPTLVYTQVVYSVAFAETGLPAGLVWNVTFNGVTMLTTTCNGCSNTLDFAPEPNGSYAYTVAKNPGYSTSFPYTGTETINGGALAVAVVYGKGYDVTFWELGLPSGLSWKVTVNGLTETRSTNGLLDMLSWSGLTNGTYAYSITGNPGWHEFTAAYNGKVVIHGGSVAFLLLYLRVTYSVTFSEKGLAAGLAWSVTLGGVTKLLKTNGGVDTLTFFGLPNGTYAYSIAAISGWSQTTLSATGSVVVNGASVVEKTLVYVA